MIVLISLFDAQRVTTLYKSQLSTHASVHSYVFIAIACSRLPTADVPLPLGSRIITLPQLPASHSNGWQQLTPAVNWLIHLLTK
jgi:hypothetical protein